MMAKVSMLIIIAKQSKITSQLYIIAIEYVGQSKQLTSQLYMIAKKSKLIRQ